MDNLLQLITLCFIFLLLLTLLFQNPKSNLKIPGPRRLPVIGTLHKLSLKPHLNFMELRKIYGDIFCISLGSLQCVVLNGHKTIIEAFCSQTVEFAGRAQTYFFRLLAEYGIFAFMDHSAKLKFFRKLTVQSINRTLSPHSFTEDYAASLDKVCRSFVNTLLENEKRPYDPINDIRKTMFLFMSSFSFGQQFTKLDDTILNFFKKEEENRKHVSKLSLCDFFPLLKPFIGSIAAVKSMLKDEVSSINNMFQERLTMNREYIECATDAFIEYAEQINKRSDSEVIISHKDIVSLLFTLFAGGIDTTTTFLQYIILNLIIYPEHLKKIQDEIDLVVSKDKRPSVNDIEKMIKLRAFLLEIERYYCFLPIGISRSITKDTVFRSFFLPKGTIILPNIYSAHFDSLIWKNPEKFDPSRFIAKDENAIDLNIANNILLFGAGRRRCPGQYLARTNIAVIVANIYQKCSIEIAPGEKLDINDTDFDFLLHPKHVKLLITKRE